MDPWRSGQDSPGAIPRCSVAIRPTRRLLLTAGLRQRPPMQDGRRNPGPFTVSKWATWDQAEGATGSSSNPCFEASAERTGSRTTRGTLQFIFSILRQRGAPGRNPTTPGTPCATRRPRGGDCQTNPPVGPVPFATCKIAGPTCTPAPGAFLSGATSSTPAGLHPFRVCAHPPVDFGGVRARSVGSRVWNRRVR